jgi:protocatechuate 3,4-dioxygenase beta subunit
MHRLFRPIRLVTILLIAITTSVCSAQSPKPAEPQGAWKITVAQETEPGERLVVSGTVFDSAGAPLAGASVYVYHTDINGHYSGETTNSSNPRLNGTMRTNAQGRYEFETIKPGPYPSARVPAHIHFVVNAPGHKQKIFEIVFEGDGFINDEIRNDAKNEDGMFSIRALQKDKDGKLRCVQDIKLRGQ